MQCVLGNKWLLYHISSVASGTSLSEEGKCMWLLEIHRFKKFVLSDSSTVLREQAGTTEALDKSGSFFTRDSLRICCVLVGKNGFGFGFFLNNPNMRFS